MSDNSSIHCANSEAGHPAAWHNELPTGASIESENEPIRVATSVSVSGAIGFGVDYLQYTTGELQ
jgi:hypothetical protein